MHAARVESGKVLLALGAIPVQELVEEVAESVRMRVAAADKEVVVRVPDDVGMAWGDRQRVLQVLLNLMMNAIKYAVPGRDEIGVEGDGGDCVLYVEDEGPGLTSQQQVQIFHSFRQFHDAGDGVGLGLAISRRLAEAMGGHLDVTSAPGQASRFCLHLRSAAEVTSGWGPALGSTEPGSSEG